MQNVFIFVCQIMVKVFRRKSLKKIENNGEIYYNDRRHVGFKTSKNV